MFGKKISHEKLFKHIVNDCRSVFYKCPNQKCEHFVSKFKGTIHYLKDKDKVTLSGTDCKYMEIYWSNCDQMFEYKQFSIHLCNKLWEKETNLLCEELNKEKRNNQIDGNENDQLDDLIDIND